MDTQKVILRISELCASKGVTVNAMLKECGLSKSVVDNLKKGSISSVDKFLMMADYFDVSVDYLLGRQQKAVPVAPSALSPPEEKLLSLFRSLNDNGQTLALQSVQAFVRSGDFTRQDIKSHA